MFFFILFILIPTSYSITYHDIFCNRQEKEQVRRKELIEKIDKILLQIGNVIRHDHAKKHINRAKFLRYYHKWDYKNKRLKRKSWNYVEDTVTKGCPLI